MCAYNPGVQDISGQFKAQAIQSIGSDIAKGIQQFSQNQQLASANMGKFMGAVRANPELLSIFSDHLPDNSDSTSETDTTLADAGASWKQQPSGPPPPPEAIKAFVKVQGGKTPSLAESAILANFVDSYGQEKQARTMNQLREQQAAQANAQAQRLIQEGEMAKQALVQANADKAAMAAAFRPFTKQGATETAVAAGTPFQNLPQQGAPFNAPEFLQKFFGAGGSPAAIDKVDTVIKTMATPGKALPAIGPIRQIHAVDAKGNPVIRSVDSNTGEVLGEGPTQRLYMSPQEAAEKTRLEERAKLDETRNSKFLTDLSASGEQARAKLADIQSIKSLYDQGAQTGFGQPFFTSLRGAGKSILGIGDEKKLADQQLLETELMKHVATFTQEMNRGEGSISEWERKAFAAGAANPNRSKEANLALVNAAAQLNQRTALLDAERRKLEEMDVEPKQIRLRIEKMREQTPIPALQLLTQIANTQSDETDILKKADAIISGKR